MNIIAATSANELQAVRELFQEYAASLGVDLGYQNFTQELAGLPGAYAPPRGRLLLAADECGPAGCVGLRPFDDEAGELKRLYVRPDRQGRGTGRLLAERVITEARDLGYASIRLDTYPTMHSAIRLYESLGFVRRAPYFETPVAGNVFMELRLANAGSSGQKS